MRIGAESHYCHEPAKIFAERAIEKNTSQEIASTISSYSLSGNFSYHNDLHMVDFKLIKEWCHYGIND